MGVIIILGDPRTTVKGEAVGMAASPWVTLSNCGLSSAAAPHHVY